MHTVQISPFGHQYTVICECNRTFCISGYIDARRECENSQQALNQVTEWQRNAENSISTTIYSIKTIMYDAAMVYIGEKALKTALKLWSFERRDDHCSSKQRKKNRQNTMLLLIYDLNITSW